MTNAHNDECAPHMPPMSRERRKLFLLCFVTVMVAFPFVSRQLSIRRTLLSLDLKANMDVTNADMLQADSRPKHPATVTFTGRVNVSYTLTKGESYNMTFAGSAYRCPIGKGQIKKKPVWRDSLEESLEPSLNFTTHVDTNLRILVLGDSVAIQFGQLLEEAFGAIPSSRELLYESWKSHEGMTIASTKGGGAIANFRMTGMFLAIHEGKPLPNYGKGWYRSHVEQLVQHPHLVSNDEHSIEGTGSFDVLIFRMNHGWLKLQEITKETIEESIQHAHDLFGVKKVIIIDVPFSNNVKTVNDLWEQKRTNDMIHGLPSTMIFREEPSGKPDKVQVVTLKLSQFTEHFMFHNANLLGMNTSDSSVYSLERPVGCGEFPLSIAQGCSARSNASSCDCRRNRVSKDGLHWCMESFGGRFSAGIACLTACFQPGLRVDKDELGHCEAKCNSQYMSLEPVHFPS